MRNRNPHRRWREGQTLVLVAVAIPVIVVLGILGVDVALARSVQMDLQTAVDAAALAGSQQAQKVQVYRCIQTQLTVGKNTCDDYTPGLYSYYYTLNVPQAQAAAEATFNQNAAALDLANTASGGTTYPYSCTNGTCQFNGKRLALEAVFPWYNANAVTVANPTGATIASSGAVFPSTPPPGDTINQPAATGFYVKAVVQYDSFLFGLLGPKRVLGFARDSLSQFYYNAQEATTPQTLQSNQSWYGSPTLNPTANCPANTCP